MMDSSLKMTKKTPIVVSEVEEFEENSFDFNEEAEE